MSLEIGVNSWASVSEADTYLFERLGSSDWVTDLAETALVGIASKELYLVSAFRLLISAPTYSIPASSTDSNVIKAQIEMAYYLLNNYTSFNSSEDLKARGVIEFDYSKVGEKFNSDGTGAGTSFPSAVQGYLNAYLSNNLFHDIEVS